MSWRLEWSNRALKDADALDRRVKARILTAIERLASTERGDLRHLHGKDAEWRVRVGAWRVKITFDERSDTMTVLRVLPRGRAYRR